MDNLISIIIPSFNRAHCLSESVESVLNQSASNWELIIVDDGSTDDTRKVIDAYLTDSRVTYFFQKNKGVSASRNKGVELSRGGYLIFVDSDDLICPNLISSLNELDFHGYDLICWQVLKSIHGKTWLLKPKKLEKIYNNVRASFLAGSICYNKALFLSVGGFDAEMSFGENYELGMRIAEIPDLKIKMINEPLLMYRVPRERKSNSIENRLSSYMHLYQKHKKKFTNDKVSNSKMNYLLGYIHEQKGCTTEARKYYRKAWKAFWLNYKALFKIIFFQVDQR